MRDLLGSAALAASVLVADLGFSGCSPGTDSDKAKPETGNMGGAMDKMDTGKTEPTK